MNASPAATRYAPAMAVARDGTVAAASSSGFQWTVHRRDETVAFLTTPLVGLGDGDDLDVSVELGAGASAAITMQGPTALIRTEATTSQRWSLRLGEGAHLSFLPWLSLPFPGSRSRSTVEAELAGGASLVGWEILAIGRVALDERFRFEELRSEWRISCADRLLVDDRLFVRGCEREDAEILLAGRTHLGTLYVAGIGPDALPLEALRRPLEALDLAGASRPAPDLLVARALDRSSERIEQAFWPIVSAARRGAGRPPLSPASVARRWFR